MSVWLHRSEGYSEIGSTKDRVCSWNAGRPSTGRRGRGGPCHGGWCEKARIALRSVKRAFQGCRCDCDTGPGGATTTTDNDDQILQRRAQGCARCRPILALDSLEVVDRSAQATLPGRSSARRVRSRFAHDTHRCSQHSSPGPPSLRGPIVPLLIALSPRNTRLWPRACPRATRRSSHRETPSSPSLSPHPCQPSMS